MTALKGLVGGLTWVVLFGAAFGEPPSTISLLIVDGMNNHHWPRATKILKEILGGIGQFRANVSTTPAAHAPKEAWAKWQPDFAKCNVVLSNFNGGHTAKDLHWPRET
jgi:hypothetical protein